MPSSSSTKSTTTNGPQTLSFRHTINSVQREVLVWGKYVYCGHKDYPACGCDFALALDFDGKQRPGEEPHLVYWMVWPKGERFQPKEYYHRYHRLRQEVAQRLGLQRPNEYIIV